MGIATLWLRVLVVLGLVACSASPPRSMVQARPKIMLDAQGHPLLITQGGQGLGVQAPVAAQSRNIHKAPAKTLEETYTPVESYEQQTAVRQQHFYVVPSGIGAAGSGEEVLSSGGASDRKKATEPILNAVVTWRPLLEHPVVTPPLNQELYTQLRQWIQHLHKKAYTKVHPGVSLNLVKEDFHTLNASWVALALIVPKQHSTSWQLYLYGRKGGALISPKFWAVVCLDDKAQMQVGQLGRFTHYRPADDWHWQGWRGPVQMLATTRKLIILLPAGADYTEGQWVLDTPPVTVQ